MSHRLFNELSGPEAKAIATEMGVHENSPLGMPLVEISVEDGLIEVRAHAQESFTSLSMMLGRKSDVTNIIFTMTDRETGVELITERDSEGQIKAYRHDVAGDSLRVLSPTQPEADEVRLREMSYKVIQRILQTNTAKFT